MNAQTQAAITEFQTILGQTPPSGVIEPNSPTLIAMNDPASVRRWAESRSAMGGAGSAGVTIPPMATPIERQQIERIIRESRAAPGSDPLVVLNTLLQSNNYGHFKNALNAVGAAQWAGEFSNAVRVLRSLGMSNETIVSLFTQAFTLENGRGFAKFLELLRTRPMLGPSVQRLARLGTALNVVAVLLCTVEVANHINRNQYGAATAEIYGVVMQIGVPWAGFVDAVQTVLFSYAPGLRSAPAVGYLFRILNAVNPIGAGKVFIDGLVATVQSLITGRGELDLRVMGPMVDRIRATPMAVFAEMGEAMVGGVDAPRVNYRGVNPPAGQR